MHAGLTVQFSSFCKLAPAILCLPACLSAKLASQPAGFEYLLQQAGVKGSYDLGRRGPLALGSAFRSVLRPFWAARVLRPEFGGLLRPNKAGGPLRPGIGGLLRLFWAAQALRTQNGRVSRCFGPQHWYGQKYDFSAYVSTGGQACARWPATRPFATRPFCKIHPPATRLSCPPTTTIRRQPPPLARSPAPASQPLVSCQLLARPSRQSSTAAWPCQSPNQPPAATRASRQPLAAASHSPSLASSRPVQPPASRPPAKRSQPAARVASKPATHQPPAASCQQGPASQPPKPAIQLPAKRSRQPLAQPAAGCQPSAQPASQPPALPAAQPSQPPASRLSSAAACHSPAASGAPPASQPSVSFDCWRSSSAAPLRAIADSFAPLSLLPAPPSPPYFAAALLPPCCRPAATLLYRRCCCLCRYHIAIEL
ncbi:uncharacterized protein PSFLO_00938 [Pseudozyma flocculosa]|uniref:Uncharacterized protein n=1 Tax=Pseudozyma flocculosa TaxID=84751 RepID=A0A5C3EVE6_9BASI|nr:uncharacterized protein PSFLO_00938 [Pseudozyma flocculosa]